MTALTRRFLVPVLVVLVALLAGCGSMGATRSPRDQMLYEYVSAIRWSDFDRAVGFLDPEGPMPDAVEIERLKQFQVSGYDVRTVDEPAEGEYMQLVEIRLVNRHTQAERVVADRQVWRWDAEAERWWLTTGLPDPTAR